MSQLIGRATIHADGNMLYMENGAKANPGGVTRNFERHGGKTYHHAEEAPPSVEGNLLVTADTDVVALTSLEDVTVIFECDTGQKYVMAHAFTEKPVEIDASSGKSDIKLVGDSWDAM